MTTKPEFIIVPGAWHSPEAFNSTTILLQNAGYIVHGISLPSVGASPPLQSFDPDVSVIQDAINKPLSSGKDVVIVYHSYGGVPGSEALGEYIKTLESGEKKVGWGIVRRLVYCCAFVLPEGGSLMAALGFKPLPWFIIDVRTFFLTLIPSIFNVRLYFQQILPLNVEIATAISTWLGELPSLLTFTPERKPVAEFST
jgi:pimeloyl-ACP methyl ester carboxylesterase